MSTHEVTNQAAAARGLQPVRRRTARSPRRSTREGAGWAEDRARRFGAVVGGEPIALGRAGERARAGAAHARPLRQPHRRGRVPPRVAPADASSPSRTGCTRCPGATRAPGAHVARAALFYLLSQVEAGVGCPISMTYAVVPALRAQPELAAEWEPRLTSTEYDPRMIPARGEARRDLRHGDDREAGRLRRARQHDARPRRSARGGPGGEYELTGHKWFCSAPMCDAFLVLAQTERGLSCFLVPRWLPDGTRNALPHPAPEGQARQPLERVERGRVRRRVGAAWSARRGAACRRSSRWSTTRASTA